MRYILLLWLSTGYSGTSYIQEFYTEDSCNKAAIKMIDNLSLKNKDYMGWRNSSFYICEKK